MKLPFTNVLRWGKLKIDQVYKRENQLLAEIVAKSDWTELERRKGNICKQIVRVLL